VIGKETKYEFEVKWAERVNTFVQLRANLPEVHHEDLTEATAMLHTLVQVAANKIFG